jgi:hypothetical protein
MAEEGMVCMISRGDIKCHRVKDEGGGNKKEYGNSDNIHS